MVQIDCQFASEKVNLEISTEQVVAAARWSPSSWQPSVDGAQSLLRSARRVPSPARQRSSWVSLRPGVSDQEALVGRADQGMSLTALLDEIKARRAKPRCNEQWWNRISQSAQLSVLTVKWQVCHGRSKRLSRRGSAAQWRWMLIDLISWMIRHSMAHQEIQSERRATLHTSSCGVR